MPINDDALMGLITTGSTMTLNSIRTTIRTLKLETTSDERQEGYNSAIKDVLSIIGIYETVTVAVERQVKDNA